MLTRKSRLLLGLTAAVPLLFAACTDNSIFNPMADAAGTYQLTVFAGRSIPASFTIQPGDLNFPQAPNGGSLGVTGGTMVLSNNGTFIETDNYTIVPSDRPTVQTQFRSSGTWNLNGTDFSFSDPARGRQDFGTLEPDINNNMTINYTEDDGSGTGTFVSYEYKR